MYIVWELFQALIYRLLELMVVVYLTGVWKGYIAKKLHGVLGIELRAPSSIAILYGSVIGLIEKELGPKVYIVVPFNNNAVTMLLVMICMYIAMYLGTYLGT
jgi:hypothetical protein